MKLLPQLNLNATNPGACFEPDSWLHSHADTVIESINPTTGQLIATVNTNTAEDYQQVIQAAQQAFSLFLCLCKQQT